MSNNMPYGMWSKQNIIAIISFKYYIVKEMIYFFVVGCTTNV